MTRSKGPWRSDDDIPHDGRSSPDRGPLAARGWTLLFHPLLLDQLERLTAAAEAERPRQASGSATGPNTKLLLALRRLIFDEIPEDPARAKYRHGGTLGEHLKHWMRAKFGNGRFRLFFRYRGDVRLIVFAGVNDAETLRTYGSRTDAYAVFQRMLGTGNPPDDGDALVRSAYSPAAADRARPLAPGEPPDEGR